MNDNLSAQTPAQEPDGADLWQARDRQIAEALGWDASGWKWMKQGKRSTHPICYHLDLQAALDACKQLGYSFELLRHVPPMPPFVEATCRIYHVRTDKAFRAYADTEAQSVVLALCVALDARKEGAE